MIEPKVFSVGQINRYIKNLLENDFILNSLLVQGEISNFKAHSSGHWYFTLKDAQGAISCVIFRQDAVNIPFEPENGMLQGTVTSVTFKGVHYEIIVDIDNFKWMIQTTDYQEVGSTIGLVIEPDAIHIMKKSEYSGLYGDYSSFSDEFDELSQVQVGEE